MTNERRKLVLCSTRRNPSRRYLVRWQDEDAGWKQVQVTATSEQEVRNLMGDLVPHTDLHIRAYG